MRRWWKVALTVVGALAIGVVAAQSVVVKMSKDHIADLEWSQAITDARASMDTISPDVGTIQFLRRGYSIQLESVEYLPAGLHLRGRIGNPHLLYLSNLTLRISAIHPLYKYRDDFRKDRWAFIFGPQAIGSAQSSPLRVLAPGETAPFDITFPNVTQTKDPLELKMEFSGERY